MDWEDSSIEQGAANTLLRSVCSVISPCQGEGDGSGQPTGERYGYVLSDKLALATGVGSPGPCWRAGTLPPAGASPSLRLWGRRCNLSFCGRPVLLVGAKGGDRWK